MGQPRNTPKYPKIPDIPGNTRNTRKYPKVKKIPGNTWSYFSTLLPDPNPTRYPVFCPIPDPTRPDPILKNPTRWALITARLVWYQRLYIPDIGHRFWGNPDTLVRPFNLIMYHWSFSFAPSFESELNCWSIKNSAFLTKNFISTVKSQSMSFNLTDKCLIHFLSGLSHCPIGPSAQTPWEFDSRGDWKKGWGQKLFLFWPRYTLQLDL